MAELVARLAPYRAVLASRVRSQRAYRASFVVDLVASALVTVTEFAEVWVLFHNVDVLGGLTLAQVMLVFGLGFLMPVVVVGANLVGVVKAKQLAKARTYVIFGTFVFGAAATPSTDPFSMLALAIPMSLLFLAAEIICRFNDKRRARRATAELATS